MGVWILAGVGSGCDWSGTVFLVPGFNVQMFKCFVLYFFLSSEFGSYLFPFHAGLTRCSDVSSKEGTRSWFILSSLPTTLNLDNDPDVSEVKKASDPVRRLVFILLSSGAENCLLSYSFKHIQSYSLVFPQNSESAHHRASRPDPVPKVSIHEKTIVSPIFQGSIESMPFPSLCLFSTPK